MSADDDVHVVNVDEFRLFTPYEDLDYIVLRITTRDAKVFNFGLDRKHFTHTVRVWAFDLGAIESAIESGAPIPGKPMGQPDRKAS